MTGSGTSRSHEAIAAVLLALAAVTTAWCSLQATHWHGEQARAGAKSNALRIQVVRAEGLADTQQQVDIATFIQWANAQNSGNSELAAFYRSRFREEFRPAFDAWLATNPLVATGAPSTPFTMEEYALQSRAQAEQLDAESAKAAARAGRSIERAEAYVLAVVLLALTLFFAATGARFGSPRVRSVMVGLAGAMFLVTVAWLVTLPKGITI